MEKITQELFTRKQLESFFINQNIDINFGNFFTAILLSLILAYVVKFTYTKVSRTLNDKEYFSDTFIPLAIITTLVITVIKFSLALSLGLVGALSIVRFRAAIKEPEELVYLFLVIAAGLGCGSGQIKITTIGILFSLIIVTIYSQFFRQKKNKIAEVLNLAIISNQDLNENQINRIVGLVKSMTTELELVSIVKSSSETNINFDIKTNDFKKLNHLINKIKLSKKDIKVIVARANNLSL